MQKLGERSKLSAINKVTAATQGHRKAEYAADSPTLGPERGPGHTELAAEPGLRPWHSTCIQAPRRPRNTWMGLGRRKGRGTGMWDYKKLETPKMGGCHKLQRRRGASWPLTFLAGVGLGPGRGRLDFIKLEAARNLTICDIRSEVSC